MKHITDIYLNQAVNGQAHFRIVHNEFFEEPTYQWWSAPGGAMGIWFVIDGDHYKIPFSNLRGIKERDEA